MALINATPAMVISLTGEQSQPITRPSPWISATSLTATADAAGAATTLLAGYATNDRVIQVPPGANYMLTRIEGAASIGTAPKYVLYTADAAGVLALCPNVAGDVEVANAGGSQQIGTSKYVIKASKANEHIHDVQGKDRVVVQITTAGTDSAKLWVSFI